MRGPARAALVPPTPRSTSCALAEPRVAHLACPGARGCGEVTPSPLKWACHRPPEERQMGQSEWRPNIRSLRQATACPPNRSNHTGRLGRREPHAAECHRKLNRRAPRRSRYGAGIIVRVRQSPSRGSTVRAAHDGLGGVCRGRRTRQQIVVAAGWRSVSVVLRLAGCVEVLDIAENGGAALKQDQLCRCHYGVSSRDNCKDNRYAFRCS